MLYFKIWLEQITTEQNQGIKKLYLLVRNILLDIRSQMTQHGFEEFDDAKDFAKFYLNFRKVYKLSQNVKGWKGSKIEIALPEDIKTTFPNIIEPFYISFPFEEDEIGGMVVDNSGKIDELRVNLKYLLDFEKYKGTLQHELQHIVNIGSEPNHNIDNTLLRMMDYMCNDGEIAAHAKEYAYRYYKMFPKDEKLDFTKFKMNFFKKGFTGLDNFINLGEDSERLRQKYNISNDNNQMIICYKKFITELLNSFIYYKK